MQQTKDSLTLPCCDVAVFSIGASVFPFDISRDFAGRRKMGAGSGKTRGNICRKGRCRRVADVNLLHPDEAKSKGGLARNGKRRWAGERVTTGERQWGVAVHRSLIILSYYLSSFINTSLSSRGYLSPEQKVKEAVEEERKAE